MKQAVERDAIENKYKGDRDVGNSYYDGRKDKYRCAASRA